MTGKGATEGNQYAKKEERGRTISLYVSGEDFALIRQILQSHGLPSTDASCVKYAKKAATGGIYQLVLAKKNELGGNMGQVIEVRFVNPANAEILADEFTLTSVKYDPKDHTLMHRQSIALALRQWSSSAGELKEIERTIGPEFTGSGANTAWQYNYRCVLDSSGEDPEEREIIAMLFTQYREKTE